MIGYIRGEILECTEGKVLVVLGSNPQEAIGYQLSIPQGAQYLALAPQKPIELFVYTHVREDALDLYGFISKSEKELFLTLLSVTGIGPKGALGILSGASSDELIDAILEGDKEFLTRIPGIGKKTAERVILELSDPLRKKIDAGLFQDSRALGATARNRGIPHSVSHRALTGSSAVLRDAKDALLGLGYREQETEELLNQALAGLEEVPGKAEELIRRALRQPV